MRLPINSRLILFAVTLITATIPDIVAVGEVEGMTRLPAGPETDQIIAIIDQMADASKH